MTHRTDKTATLPFKERPIIFRGAMVRAILEGRKTMTRRIVKLQPVKHLGYKYGVDGPGTSRMQGTVKGCFWKLDKPIFCPYGKPGDRLWVKETHYRWGRWVKNGLTKTGRQRWRFSVSGTAPGLRGVRYLDDSLTPAWKRTELGWHKRPSIFMPRIASRILLEITNVRVERLQEITRKDAIAEGCEERSEDGAWLGPEVAFCLLWESINGRDSWKANPWVWVVEFKRIK